MKVALLRCQDIDPNLYADDYLFMDILRKDQVEIEYVNWDEKNHNWSQYNLVLIRTTWDYMGRLDEFLTTLKDIESQTTLMHPHSTVSWNINKKYLLELKELGFPIIESKLEEYIDQDKATSLFKDIDKGEGIIIKPTVGGSSKGIQFLKKPEDFQGPIQGEWLVQPFQKNIQKKGEYSLLYFDHEFSHAVYKLPKEGEFRSQEEFDSTIDNFSPTEDMKKLGHDLLEKIPHENMYARVDIVLDDQDNPRIMELEMIEPCLFLKYNKAGPENIAQAIRKRLGLA